MFYISIFCSSISLLTVILMMNVCSLNWLQYLFSSSKIFADTFLETYRQLLVIGEGIPYCSKNAMNASIWTKVMHCRRQGRRPMGHWAVSQNKPKINGANLSFGPPSSRYTRIFFFSKVLSVKRPLQKVQYPLNEANSDREMHQICEAGIFDTKNNDRDLLFVYIPSEKILVAKFTCQI